MRTHATITGLAATIVLAPAALAQTTWTVTGTNGVQAAIAAAAPGDVILLPNTGGFPDYTPFVVDKGVTIRGNGCRVGWPLGMSTTFDLSIQVPPGQRAHLDGLDLTWSPHANGNVGMRIVHSGGAASVQRCSVVHAGGSPVHVAAGALVLASCYLRGVRIPGPFGYAVVNGSAGVTVQGGAATLRDCTVIGFDAGAFYFGIHPIPQPPGPGADLFAGSLHAERTTFTGGSGAFSIATFPGACGIRLLGPAQVWVADSTILGGSTASTATGGSAVCNNGGGAPVQLANNTLVPGVPGAPPTSTGPVNPAAPLIRLAISPPFQRGVTSLLSCTGQPGAMFALGVALDAQPSFHPFLVEPVWIVNNVPVAFGLLDAAGFATMTVVVPPTTILQNQVVWCQVASGFALPLRATTVGGGLIL